MEVSAEAPASLLALALFPAADGTGGARPGTGGAPMAGAADVFGPPPTIGAERSLTWVTFFSLAPAWMSPSSAPCNWSV